MRRARIEQPERGGGVPQYQRMLLDKRKNILANFGMPFDASAKFDYKAEEDQAQVSHDEFVCLQLNSLDYTQLRLIEEALDRIASGDYGTCLECEQPIPTKRLRALPWARYCVGCQEEIVSREEQQIL